MIRTASERLIARLPPGRRPPALMVALHIWSLSHGIASLFGRGDAGRRKLPMSAEELLEAGVLVYLRGLGLRRRRAHVFVNGRSAAPLDKRRALL